MKDLKDLCQTADFLCNEPNTREQKLYIARCLLNLLKFPCESEFSTVLGKVHTKKAHVEFSFVDQKSMTFKRNYACKVNVLHSGTVHGLGPCPIKLSRV